jgi:hypothetical protein
MPLMLSSLAPHAMVIALMTMEAVANAVPGEVLGLVARMLIGLVP